MAGVSMRRQALHLTRISCISRIRRITYLAASALALCTLLPILGAVALQAAPTARAAGGCGTTQACIHWDGSMIYPGQNNGNPEGPVGEHALVHGEGFLANMSQQIQLQVVKGDVNNIGGQSPVEFCKLSTPKVPVGQAPVDAAGKFDFNFDWPSAASSSDWSICAYGSDGLPVLNGNIDDGPFRVLSANPPSITLSTNSIQPGQAITITGKNWLPAQGGIFVYIGPCADCGGTPIVSTTLSSDASGNFSVSLPIASNTAPATYIASAHNTNGQGSVLDLINNGPHLTVTAAAAPTATAAPSPTATATKAATATTASAGNGGGNSSSSNGAGGNTGLLIGLAVAIVVLLAALAGILAYLATQRRNAAPSGPNGPGGYGQPFGAKIGRASCRERV